MSTYTFCRNTAPTRVIIDSANRDSDSVSECDFKFTLERPLYEIMKIRLDYCSIPNAAKNITSSNNSISFNDGSVRTASVSAGFYNITQLCSALGTAMTNAGGGGNFTVTYNSITMKVTIAHDSGNFTLSMANSSIAEVLGFSSTNLSGADSFISDKIVNLLRPTSFIISINEFDRPILCSSGKTILGSFIIPITTNPGEIEIFNPQYETFIPFKIPKTIHRLHIKILDEQGNIMDFGGLNSIFAFSFCILCRCPCNQKSLLNSMDPFAKIIKGIKE